MSKLKEIDRAVVAMLIEQYGFSQLMSELEDYCCTVLFFYYLIEVKGRDRICTCNLLVMSQA